MDNEPMNTPTPEPVNNGPVDNGKNFSIAALVLGILGIIGGWIPVVCYFTTVCAVLGLVFGIKGRKKSVAAEGKASGLATAGMVLGIIGLAFAVLGLLCVGCATALVCLGLSEAVENAAGAVILFF